MKPVELEAKGISRPFTSLVVAIHDSYYKMKGLVPPELTNICEMVHILLGKFWVTLLTRKFLGTPIRLWLTVLLGAVIVLITTNPTLAKIIVGIIGLAFVQAVVMITVLTVSVFFPLRYVEAIQHQFGEKHHERNVFLFFAFTQVYLALLILLTPVGYYQIVALLTLAGGICFLVYVAIFAGLQFARDNEDERAIRLFQIGERVSEAGSDFGQTLSLIFKSIKDKTCFPIHIKRSP